MVLSTVVKYERVCKSFPDEVMIVCSVLVIGKRPSPAKKCLSSSDRPTYITLNVPRRSVSVMRGLAPDYNVPTSLRGFEHIIDGINI